MSSTPPPTIDVCAIARLARLSVPEAELPAIASALASIFAHARCLDQLDLSNAPPLSHAADLEATLADDVAGGELPRGALEAIAPSMDGPYIRVPKVLHTHGNS